MSGYNGSSLMRQFMDGKKKNPAPRKPAGKKAPANRDTSPKRQKSSSNSKKHHKKSKKSKKEKSKKKKSSKKPAAPKAFNKRFIPFDGDKDFNVEVLSEGVGEAPLAEPKSADLTRLRLVNKSDPTRAISMLALKNASDKRWEILNKENQTKMLQRGELKMVGGCAITRTTIVQWKNRWPIYDGEDNAAESENAKASQALEFYPLVSDNYAATMPQFSKIGIGLYDFDERTPFSEISADTPTFPIPAELMPDSENQDLASDADSSDSSDSDSSDKDEENDDDHDSSDDDVLEAKFKREVVAEKMPTPEYAKPTAGLDRSKFASLGDGLKNLRQITAQSGALASDIIENTSLKTTIGKGNIGFEAPKVDAVAAAEPEKSPAKKRTAIETPVKESVPKRLKTPILATKLPPLTDAADHRVPADKAYYTAKKIGAAVDVLAKAGKLAERMNQELQKTLETDKRTFAEFLGSKDTSFIAKAAIGLLFELRYSEINTPLFADPRTPIAIFSEALTLTLQSGEESVIGELKAAKEMLKTTESDYLIPQTEPATLLEHFRSGVLDKLEEGWFRVNLPSSSMIQHDIGMRSEKEISDYNAAMNASLPMLNAMLTLVAAWKHVDDAEPVVDNDFSIF